MLCPVPDDFCIIAQFPDLSTAFLRFFKKISCGFHCVKVIEFLRENAVGRDGTGFFGREEGQTWPKAGTAL